MYFLIHESNKSTYEGGILKYSYNLFELLYSEKTSKEAVNNKLPKTMGKINFQPRSNNWSILTLGNAHFTMLEINI